jgi:hypothetical protein
MQRRQFITLASASAAAASLAGVCRADAAGRLAASALAAERARDEAKARAGTKAHGMRAVPGAAKVTVAKDDEWYLAFTGVAYAKGALVAAYLKTDQHLRTTTDIMVARSEDGGRTWKDHRSLSHLDILRDKAVWVSPEINATRDGKLLLICDKGNRRADQPHPTLAKWQTADFGMSNHLFTSDDGGRTWAGPVKIDDVGGEPERITELSNGVWVYTRTDSKPTAAIKHPAPTWGPNYYRSTAVFSEDKGRTWSRTAAVFDDPLYGDCEVGLCEYAPGKLVAVSRCGDAGSRYGQPSRLAYSQDFGRTWTKPVLAPFYGHRPIPGLLKSGRMLVTFRNAWGTPASYAIVCSPTERFAYQPNSFIWDESRCRLQGGAMELRTSEGSRGAVEFTLYPVEDEDSAVEFECELAVKEADKEGCLVSAGAWVRFEPRRVSIVGRDGEGFAVDATRFRRYRLVNRDNKLSVYADGKLRLQTSVEGIHTRYVHFGNRPGGQPPLGTLADEGAGAARRGEWMPPSVFGKQRDARRPVQYAQNTSHTLWRAIRARVMNRRDHSIDWRWTARDGYPDQFRRDRLVRLDRNGSFIVGDCGYSGWAEQPDGRVVIVDYTTGDEGRLPPLVRAYVVGERDLG